MSHITSSSRPDCDIWEFVTCAKCHLPFAPDPSAPLQVPFWLTECGHVICNQHLNADQSCCECGAQQIQMIPLQRELDPPMSDWFCSVPQAMDAISYSVNFQHTLLMSLVRFLRTKAAQQKDALLRVSHEREEVKRFRKIVEELRAENQQLRLYAGLDGSGSSSAGDSSGKRRRIDAYNNDGARHQSRPRSDVTSIGPNRLTLPADHPPPVLGQKSLNTTTANLDGPLQGPRSSSSRLRQHVGVPSHAAKQPSAFEPQKGTSNQQHRHAMMPPPPPVHEKAKRVFPTSGPTGVFPSHSRGKLLTGDASQAQAGRQSLLDAAFVSTVPRGMTPRPPSSFTPRVSTSHTVSDVNSRFVPQTPDSRRFVPAANAAGSRVHSRAGNPQVNPVVHNGQRVPFFPRTKIG